MRHAVCALLIAATAFPAVAFADKPAKDKKQHKDGGRDGAVTVRFAVSQREAANAYFVETRGRGKCPPGLAKKRNGCLPPGQAKKRYAVGRHLPRGIVLEEPPPELVVRIGSAPDGYRYALLDGDLLKLAIGTLLVVDAIDGLVD
jgi:hypothetical protein